MNMADQAEKLRTVAAGKRPEESPERRKPFAGMSRVIAVTSGKGGVGKTSLVVNLGLSLVRNGYRVVLIDADLGLANIDVMINSYPSHNLNDVINGSMKLKEIITRGPLDMKIIPGGSGFYDLANLDRSRRNHLLDQFKELEGEGDYILLDTAAGISRNVIDFVEAADDFILVTTPEPTALTDAYSLLKVIAGRGCRQKSNVVVNLTRNLQQGYRVFSGLKRAVQQYLPELEISYLGDIRYDIAVSSAVHDFSPFVISRPGSPASMAMARIAWRLASNEEAKEPITKGIVGFINRLKEKR